MTVSQVFVDCCRGHVTGAIDEDRPCVRRECIVCHHLECPGCDDWCDSLIGEDGDLCCDGKCIYRKEDEKS